MITITTTEQLAEFCTKAAQFPFVTVDTEFLRERTYYAQLCLIQLAVPDDGDGAAVLVDTLSEGLDLAPLYELFVNPEVVKVFHAARQDLEIFFVDKGIIPIPLFDTQVAAMVCGYGEQVGYETLVRSICNASLDKSSRFTDWSRRPLSNKQKDYALADVTHLRDIYLKLATQLKNTGRESWVSEELAVLNAPETYVVEPADAWKRVKVRSTSPRFLAVVRELAKLREEMAKDRNIPRGRVFKDDVILELAATRPTTAEDMGRSRLLQRDARKGPVSEQILQAIKHAMSLDSADLPVAPVAAPRKTGSEGLTELLRVLLKARSNEAGVAQKLIATSADIDAIASRDAAALQALRGWRYEVFGKDAERLTNGEIGLAVGPSGVVTVDL